MHLLIHAPRASGSLQHRATYRRLDTVREKPNTTRSVNALHPVIDNPTQIVYNFYVMEK